MKHSFFQNLITEEMCIWEKPRLQWTDRKLHDGPLRNRINKTHWLEQSDTYKFFDHVMRKVKKWKTIVEEDELSLKTPEMKFGDAEYIFR